MENNIRKWITLVERKTLIEAGPTTKYGDAVIHRNPVGARLLGLMRNAQSNVEPPSVTRPNVDPTAKAKVLRWLSDTDGNIHMWNHPDTLHTDVARDVLPGVSDAGGVVLAKANRYRMKTLYSGRYDDDPAKSYGKATLKTLQDRFAKLHPHLIHDPTLTFSDYNLPKVE